MNHDPNAAPDPAADPWTAGVESWWQAMSTSRQVLQDLGDQVQSAVRGAAGEVRLDDLQRVVTALGLVEQRLSQSAEQGQDLAARIDSVEAQLVALGEQVALVARAVSALGGHVEALASRPSAPNPVPAPTKASPKARRKGARPSPSDAE